MSNEEKVKQNVFIHFKRLEFSLKQKISETK